MVWYSHLFKDFPQFVVIRTVKGFSVVSEAEVGINAGHSQCSTWEHLINSGAQGVFSKFESLRKVELEK